MIASSSLLLPSSCKNFNVAHYSKNIKGINTKVGILANHDKSHKMQLQDKGYNSESYNFGVMPLFNLKHDGPQHTSVGTACSAVLKTDQFLGY